MLWKQNKDGSEKFDRYIFGRCNRAKQWQTRLFMNSDDDEAYILLLLSDGNLPTGSFVASSGLESHVKHGFSSQPDPTAAFVRDSLETYARSALPFVSDAQRIVESVYREEGDEGALERVVSDLVVLDGHYQAMTLNHVARRASQAQGVALLTLYTKGFSRPVGHLDSTEQARDVRLGILVNRIKTMVRKGDTYGHLPICWGVLTAALGLSLGMSYLSGCKIAANRFEERSQFLHLFLHARNILSASVRLNVLGPYAAQQIILHAVRPLVTFEASRCRHLRTGIVSVPGAHFDETNDGPATTWPMGEILAARHDLQHSRIFNS
jgi:urease accessory protein